MRQLAERIISLQIRCHCTSGMSVIRVSAAVSHIHTYKYCMYLHPIVPLGWQTGDGGGPSNGEQWLRSAAAARAHGCALLSPLLLLSP